MRIVSETPVPCCLNGLQLLSTSALTSLTGDDYQSSNIDQTRDYAFRDVFLDFVSARSQYTMPCGVFDFFMFQISPGMIGVRHSCSSSLLGVLSP